MPTEILISRSPGETRVAVVEDGVLAEYDTEQDAHRSVVGNIYLGRVTRVLPGMQAAFVEIGLERAAFLYVDDVVLPKAEGDDDVEVEALPGLDPADNGHEEVHTETDEATDADAAHARAEAEDTEPQNAQAPVHSPPRPRPPIQELLKAGQQILVQVRKSPFATKGARVTNYVTLPGRFLVYLPTIRRLGVSRKITQEVERKRLKAVMARHRVSNEGGFIARTLCEGKDETVLARDMAFVRSLWTEVEEKAASMSVPGLVLADLDLVLRTCRDSFSEDVNRLVCDDASEVERIRKRVLRHAPALAERIHLHAQPTPLFDAHGIRPEIEHLFERKVPLPSGGSLVIDEAEALTAIDVNTGRYVGKKDLEQTILKTNLEAAAAAAGQIRLRDLGGIIVVDFIDMQFPESRQQVQDAFLRAMARDRAKSQVAPMNEFGLVEMTRRRTRGSVVRRSTEPCPYCTGRGRLKSKEAIVLEVLRRLGRTADQHPEGRLWVSAMPEVASSLSESPLLPDLERSLGRTVTVEARSDLHQEVFHITVR